MTHKNYNDMSAMAAMRTAQFIAVGPFIFQAVAAMKKLGILAVFGDMSDDDTVAVSELVERTGLSGYAVTVLLDLAEAADLVIRNYDGTYSPSKVIHYLANDRMTGVNFAFSADVCYEGLARLADSLKSGRPEGLATLTKDHETIYPFIGFLPPAAKAAWFGFDHFYSDSVFGEILPILLSGRENPRVVDVGGNTGKFAAGVLRYRPGGRMTIVDLPEQCRLAAAHAAELGLADRIGFCPCDILESSDKLPVEGDLWWMSQFLDCFSLPQVERIAARTRASMEKGAILAVCEIFGDKAPNDIARLVIEANSLYFTALANGRSRFYHSYDLISAVEGQGFGLSREIDGLGFGHSLLIFEQRPL